MGKMGIYEIRNIENNKRYIGSSIDIENRWKQHRGMLKNNNHHSQHLQYAWDKYGEDSFVFSVLETLKNRNKLLSTEQKWMDKYKSYNPDYGYNISKVTSGCAIDKKYNFKDALLQIDKDIEERTKRNEESNIIRNIINKEIEDNMNLNPNMIFNFKKNINKLLYDIYLYFKVINYNTFYDVQVIINKEKSFRIQSLYDFPMDLCERIIFNNKINLLQIIDQRYGDSILIYANNFVDYKVYVDTNDFLEIEYDDGYIKHCISIYENVD